MRSSITNLRYTLYGIEDERLRIMLAALLEDRFKLKFHPEAKPGTVYLLQRTNGAFRPAPSARAVRGEDGKIVDAAISSIGAAGTWNMSDTSMKQLAKFAGDFIVHAPVIDETHIDGYFDYRSATDVDMSNMDIVDAAFQDFLSEMGLRLKKSNGSVETIVIDHVEKPSEN